MTPLKSKISSVKRLSAALVFGLFVFTNAVNATTKVKANNTTTLNQTGSWTGGVVPTSSDIGQWNNTSGSSGNTVSLGADMTWQGIQIANNATAWITISGANTLTLGISGFDMSASPFSVTMNCLMGIGGIQTWNVNSGMLLAANAAISGSNATYSLTKSGSGTLYFDDNNTYSGQTIVSAGVLAFSMNSGVKGGVYSYGTAAGTIVINNGGTVRLDTNDFLGAHTSVPVATVTINTGGTMASNVTFSTLNNLTLSGGTLQSNGGTSGWGSFGLKGTVTVNGTVTSNISTGTGADNNVFVGTNTAGGTTTFNVGNTASSGDDLDISSVLTNNRNSSFVAVAGGLIKSGAGTMMLSGDNTFTGGVTISNGILKAGSTTALGDVGNTITINSTGALDVNAVNLQGYTSAITINGQMDANNGAIINSGAVQQNAIRAIALGSNASIGSNGGRFDIGRGYSANTYITGNSHTLTKVGSNQVCIITQSTGLTSVVVNGGMLSGECTNVFGGVPITVNSGGQITQWGTITLSDSIYLNGGTILGQFEYGNAFSSAWSGPIALAASTIDTLMADVSSVVNPITLSGKISGTGSLVKAGTGTTTLSGTTNSYSGGTTLNAGTLVLTNPLSLGPGTSALTINGGTLQVPNGLYDTNAITVAGTATISEVGGGAVYMLGTLSSAGATDTLTVDPASTQTISFDGDLSGFTGVIILNSDTMRIRNASGANNATIYVSGGAGLTFNKALGASIQIGSLKSASGTFIRLPRPYACQVGALNGTDTIAGVIVDSNTAYPGSLTKVGTGTLTLLGANTYSGVTTISAGTIRPSTLANGGTSCALGSASNAAANLVINGGSLSYSGGTQGCDRLFTVGASGATIRSSGTGALTFSNSGSIAYSGSTTHSITFAGTNTAANTFAPVIGNDGGNAVSVTKSSAGEWVFTGANTYSGGTTISAGTLLVNNSSGSGTGTGAVSVTGATLGGTGTISGAVSLSSGATLAPGSGGTGVLTMSSNLTLASGVTYAVEMNGTTVNTLYDQTVVSGTVTLNSATLTLSLGYTPVIGDTFTIINNKGSNSVVGTFNNIAEGGTVSAVYNGNTATFQVSYADNDGNDVTLTCSNITGLPVDDYAQWHYSKKVYINTKEGGANISTDQSNFPLLVRLTSANFNFSQARSSGQDIRFSKSTGVHFPYQIERWDNANQLAELWVNVDVVKGYNDAQYITMYWGNAAAADSSNSAKVFDTTNGFVGVWHLGEASGNALDATINGIKDTAKGTIKYQETGGIAYSDSLVGSGSYLVAGNGYNTLLNMHARNKVTVSAWVNRAGAIAGNSGNVEGIAGKYKWTSNLREYCLGNNATTGFAFWVSTNGTAETALSSAVVPTLGTWYYVTGVMDATNMTIFVNGVQKAQTAQATISATTTSPFRIGLMDDDGGSNKQYFNGEIDEVIVADTNRSSDWIKLCYATQMPNQTTVVVQENYSDWKYSKNLYFNTKPSGANVTNNVVKFPILVRLDSTNFDFTTTQDSGQDLRFAKSDGTHLYYQIEKWDNIGQQAFVWVRADTIYGNDSLRYATMYWGNVNVNGMSNGKAVFDTGNGFIGVWHFSNSDFSDATSNGHNATNGGTVDTVGPIGGGRKFNPVNPDSIIIATPDTLGKPTKFSLSCWVKVDSVDQANGASEFFSISDGASIRTRGNGTKDSLAGLFHGTSWHTTVSPYPSASLLKSGWKYVAFTCDPSATSQLLYVNGGAVTPTGSSGESIAYTTGSGKTKFGKNAGGGGGYDFGGVLDEVRADKVIRDQYWIKLCYENQKPVQDLVVYNNEDYSQWAYSRKVNLNTTPSGANTANTVVNFPTLIRLTSTNFPFAQALDDGSDVRFANSLGNRLAYQIERWDRPNQLAEIWVLADTIKGNNGTQYFNMYWGKTGVGSRSKGADVFDTGNGFVGVWHLGEGSGNAFDATINGIMDTAKGTVKYQKTGGVAYSDSITGSASYFAANNAYNTLLNMSARNKVTVSAWVRREGAATGNSGNVEGIAGKYKWAASANTREYCIGNNATTGFAFWVSSNGTAETSVGSTIVPTLGTWYYVTGVMDATNMTIFVNGKQMAQTGSTTISATTTSPFRIGLMDDDGSNNKQYFNGEIDEVIVSDTNRSVDWIKLCYQNQKANQTLVDLEDYGQWASSKKIYINTTVVSPVLTTKTAMFPLLVRLDTTMINFSAAQSSGQDIRFSRADGTHFYYEKEKWDQANKNATLWVLVDTILPSSATQYITMYWGKSDAVDKSNSSAVFDTANSFVAAYHFSVSDTFGDATYNSNDGTNSSTTPNASSIIGYGRGFAKASTQKITAADANILDLTGSFTLSAWINPTTLDTADIIGKDSTAYDFEMIPTKYLRLGSNKTYYLSSAASTITTGSWYHVAATYNSTGNPIYFYVNGSQVGTSVTGAAPVATATTLYIGARASGKYFNGSIDEPRVEKTVRSADWINLCYWTQKAGLSTVITDTSSEAFLPLTVSTYPAASTSLDSCNISTHNWTIKFSAASKGGGIYWLSPDSMGTGTNQLDTNLFTIITGTTGTPDSTSKGTATLTLLDNTNVFIRLMQQRIINAVPFQVYYTIQGNGKVFIRVYTYAAAAATMTNGLEFRIATNGASGTANYYPSATASSCNYLLHSDPASNRLDPCLTLFENWSQATSITSGTRYVGLKASSWSLPAKRSQAWEFMLDFAHRNWNDSTGVGSYVSEYSHPDSLAFYSGTPYLEKTWEDHLTGHWKFEEGAGDTAFDNSGSNNPGIRTASSTWTWTSGKWGGGLSLRSGDSIKVLDNTLFDGSNTGFAVMAWVNPMATMTSGSGIFKKSNGTAGYALTGASNGSVQLNLGGTTFSGRTNVNAGSWRHVGAVYQKAGGSPDTIKLYVDGKSDTIITGSVYSFNSSGTNALIGTGFNGTIDDVRFYDEVLSDEQFKTVYQLGYCSGQGMYWLRADNNNAVNFTIDGGTYHRNFPVVQITNWWNSTALGANNPYVYMNGSQLTYNKDYYVMTDLNRSKATVGFNRAINADGTQIYIGTNSTVASTTTGMPRMYWGISTLAGTDYVWVKNFSGDIFGSSTANQFFIDWKMGISSSKGGEMWYMMSSSTTPNTIIDTTIKNSGASFGILPGTDASNAATWGAFGTSINGTYVKSSISTAPFTYTIPESSAVRVVIKLGQRDLQDSAYIFTQWTIYPTGQVFRWDSIPWVKSANISQVVHSFGMDNCTSPTITMNKKFLRCHVSNSALQDYCIAFLSFKNSGGTVAGPWTKDTFNNASDGFKTQIEFKDATTSPNTVWSAVPVQCNFYQDIQKPTMDSAYRDSACIGVQNSIGAANSARLTANGNGSTVLNSPGDLNGDGFNEKEGAYVYQADNTNTAHFTLTAHANANGDTCRFNPAFRITNYTATTVPQYVFVNSQQLVLGFGYNAWVKQSTHELIFQVYQKFCSNADIYISSNTTLAVKLDQFNAHGADGLVRLVWQTESEENNLGFFLYRRVNPRFIDSLIMSPAPVHADTVGDGSDEKTPAQLLKSKAIGTSDTIWKQVNDRIIFGALAGVSYGKRSYSLIDRNVINSVQYQYKLVAVDYNNGRDAYDKLAGAMPHQILPSVFELHGNYPNPFRGITYLKFDVPVKTRAMLNVYSMQGRLVRRIVKPDNFMKPGFYRVTWDGKDDAGRPMASGPYVYRFSAPGFAKAKVMIVMK